MAGHDDETNDQVLRLDHFLKISGVTGSGGGAKVLIQGGAVKVNGEVETRRRRKLSVGDTVDVEGTQLIVTGPPGEPGAPASAGETT
jgi:ribosome-associated protein